jgi:hypothetical protein
MAQKKEEMINREKGDKEKKLAQLLADKQKKEEKAAELRKLRLKVSIELANCFAL